MNRRQFAMISLGLATYPSIGAATLAPIARGIVKEDYGWVVRAAERYLSEAPETISVFKAERSPGGIHDYYSEADYWWPDPAKPGGPYIRRDGYSNPAKFTLHRDALILMGVIVPALTAAWKMTRKRRFALAAARHLEAWFVEPATRMNPHLDHAQAVIGINRGRGIGVIDTLQLVEVARAASLLDESSFTFASRNGVVQWFASYLDWLTTSKNGTDERDEANNHGSCWVLQAAVFAQLTGRTEIVDGCRERFKTRLVPQQIEPDGSMPLELARTKPYGYCLFNLDVLATAAHVLSTPGDNLWSYETADGRGIAKALAYMEPYIREKKRWPFKPDVEHFDDLPVRHPCLLFGGLSLNKPDLIAMWKRLDSEPQVAEIVRNFPIRQPFLWIAQE